MYNEQQYKILLKSNWGTELKVELTEVDQPYKKLKDLEFEFLVKENVVERIIILKQQKIHKINALKKVRMMLTIDKTPLISDPITVRAKKKSKKNQNNGVNRNQKKQDQQTQTSPITTRACASQTENSQEDPMVVPEKLSDGNSMVDSDIFGWSS
eukprot:CAMPEP_0117423820 /NCGR_PEP_ID=MMETSP0758-20121206/4362_1 /TAXON_ID=63605 /ORGANISM="Percolomonas cosmopolitus, Strain AE-1 (ATCC 50343)" /LENGTH=154 /DNA_ID=CAMNT_0005207227 /DNA_START=174 /DNA_END=638 /DNA_ORIENTATION=+